MYGLIITKEALRKGFYDARKSKLKNYACLNFELSIGTEIEALHKELSNGTYKPRPYIKFKVSEPKERIIYAPAFRDCVVQHAVYTIIQPIFDRTFIDQSFACRVGKGMHRAADYAQQALIRSPDDSYTLQLDIQKFFYSINREILRTLFELKIKDPQMIELMMSFTVYEGRVGIPIGNLLSQIYALIYMNQVDHFVVRQLKPRSGYVRYVDDFILFGLTRTEALEHRATIELFLHEKLRLRLSRSTIANTKRGVNFVGYRTWRGARFIRKHSMYKAKKAVRENRLDSFISHLAHASKTHSMQHLLTYAQEHNYDLYSRLPKKYHAGHYQDAQCSGWGDRAMYA